MNFNLPSPFVGNPISGSTWSFNKINDHNGSLGANDIAQDFAVILLNQNATLPSGLAAGWVGLIQDSQFVANGGSAQQYGYPVGNMTGTVPLQSFPETLTEHASSSPYYSYYSTSSINGPGMSGGPTISSYAGATVAAATQSAASGTASYLAALTPTTIGQIEYWLSQPAYGQSPAMQRLYQTLLNRLADPGGLSYWSSVFASIAPGVATALGVPYATGAEVCAQYPGIAQTFLSSTEFQQAHPNITNTQLVTLLYNNG